MTGLIIATSIIGAVSISSAIIMAIKLRRLNKKLSTTLELLITHIARPEQIDVIEEYSNVCNDFTFPNSEGF